MVLLLAACSGGHGPLARSIDGLDLPGDLVEVGESHTGPNRCSAGGCPRVSKYYISQDSPDELCTAMRRWAEENGLSESTTDGNRLSCRFWGAIHGNHMGILVTPPRDEIVPTALGQEPILIGAEHGATVKVLMN